MTFDAYEEAFAERLAIMLESDVPIDQAMLLAEECTKKHFGLPTIAKNGSSEHGIS